MDVFAGLHSCVQSSVALPAVQFGARALACNGDDEQLRASKYWFHRADAAGVSCSEIRALVLSGREPFNQKALLHVVMCGSAPLARVNTRIATPA